MKSNSVEMLPIKAIIIIIIIIICVIIMISDKWKGGKETLKTKSVSQSKLIFNKSRNWVLWNMIH